jgi:hypothetical protein
MWTFDRQIASVPSIDSECPLNTRLVVRTQTELGAPLDRSFYLVLN